MSYLAPWAKYLLYAWLAVICLAAARVDLRERRIPNKITYPSILCLIAYHTVLGGFSGAFASTMGLLAGLSVLLAPYALRKMGAGDVKLMGAVGAALCVDGLVTAFLFTCLAGGVYALVLFARKYLSDKPAGDGKMCYGAAIAAGAILAMGWNLAGMAFIKL